MTRPPLILVILRLPVQLIRLILYAVGSLCYLPIYLYCLSLRKFFFHPKFETNQLFYLIFSLPRGFLSLGGFIIGALELFVAYYIILQCNIVESNRALVITLTSLTVFALFCFRFGYNLLFNKLKFPQLKSTKEHLMLTVYMIEDLISLLFTTITILLVFRAKQIFQYKFESTSSQRKYLRFSAYMLALSLSDLVCVPFWVIVFTLHWRFPYTRRVTRKIPSEYRRKLFLIYQAVCALIDLFFVPLFLIVLLNPFMKGERLITHMKKLSVIVWRSLIFEEFTNTIYDIPAICTMTIMMASIYEIPLIFTAYRKTLSKIKSYSFKAETNELKRINNLAIQTELSEKVNTFITDTDQEYRSLYLFLLPVIIVDIAILACNLILITSVYRYLILRKKLRAQKLSASKKEDQAFDLTFTYREYRNFLYKSISLDSTEDIPHIYSTYPEQLLEEVFRLLLDIPVILISLPVIIAPWRLQTLFINAREAWNKIGDVKKQEDECSLQKQAVYCSLAGIKDYLGFICLCINLTVFWRWNYLIPEVKTIIQEFKAIPDKSLNTFIEKLNTFDGLMFETFTSAVLPDILLLPLAVIFVPFLIICPWQIPSLLQALKASQPSEFSAHRYKIIESGYNSICDFLNLIPLTITIFGLTRVKTLFILANWSNPLAVNQKDANKTISDSSVNTQDDHPDNIKVDEKPQSYSFRQKIMSLPQYFTEDERRKKLFKAGRNCCVIFLLDLSSFPFSLLIFTNLATFRKMRYLTKKIHEERKSAGSISAYCYHERKIIFHRFDLGFAALVLNIVTVLTFILTCLLLWRLPTFFILMTRKDLRDFLITNLIHDEQKREFYIKRFLKRTGVIVFFCFRQLLIDFLYLPIFIALMTITPWRCMPVFRAVYRYNLESSINKQIGKQRLLILKQFILGLKDILLMIKSSIIIVTLIRIPFFVSIILKNRFPNFNSRKGQYTLLRPRNPEPKLPLSKCINITFRELFKDLPYIPFAVLIVLIAPWRIFTVLSIIASQVTRVPTHDIESKKLTIYSRRPEILRLWGTVVKVDAVILIKTLIISIPLYKIRKVLKVYFDFLIHFRQYQEGQKSLKTEIDHEFSRFLNDLIKLICLLTILTFVLRIKKMVHRLKAYYEHNKTQHRLRLKAQKNIQTSKKDITTLNDLSWDTYGRVCQFLTITDLASLSQVNKKFYLLSQKDFYWEYQYNRSFSGNPVGAVTFKEKCIRLYKEQLVNKRIKEPMTEAQRDIIWGTMYILQDEAVESFKSIPHLLLLPAKLISWILSKVFDASRLSYNSIAPFKSIHYVDWFRTGDAVPPTNLFQDIMNFRSFENIHEALPYWLFVPIFKYICEVGYYFGGIWYYLAQKTSAGDTTEIILPVPYYYYDITQAHQATTLREMSSGIKRSFLYGIQLICFSVYLVSGVYLGILAFKDFSKYFLICFVNFFALINVYYTPIFLLSRIRPIYFRPDRAITLPIKYLKVQTIRLYRFSIRQATTFWNIFGRPLFKKIVFVIDLLQRNILKLVSLITSALETLFNAIIEKIKLLIQRRHYIKILIYVTKQSLAYGLAGDIFLTVFALVWMLWPCLIPIYLSTKIYFIPCGLISMVLTFLGYREIKLVWRSYQAK